LILIGWNVAAVGALVIAGLYTKELVKLWETWVLISLAGAGRKAMVGMHAFYKGVGKVYPRPLETQDRGTMIKGPLVRQFAYINPDRDEVRIQVVIEPEGAPAEEDDHCLAVLRMSWSVSKFIPYYDDPGKPGDHGQLPDNLKYPLSELPWYYAAEFYKRGLQDYEYVIPGAAAIAFMNDYGKGEHLQRLLEFSVSKVREFFQTFRVRQLMSVIRDEEIDTPIERTLRYKRTRILGKDIELPDDLPQTYSNKGELEHVIHTVLTWILQREIEPYGVFLNDVTLVRFAFPKRLVQANREKEAAKEEVERIQTMGPAFNAEVKRLSGDKATVDPDVAALVLADMMRSDERLTLPAMIKTGLNILGSIFGKDKK
jgi:hypothetical protein